MKKIFLLAGVLILMLGSVTILSACGSDAKTENLAGSYTESIKNFIVAESGQEDINLDEHIITDYTKDDVVYTLLYSETPSSDNEVFYLARTMEIQGKFLTDRVSEDADLSKKLTSDDPYVATTMQNHAGDVFFYVVKVLDDSYQVLRDGKEAFMAKENLYVETGTTEPVLEIVQVSKPE